MDPLSTMSAIGASLSLIDKFVGLVSKLRSGGSRPHHVEAKQEDRSLVIRSNGHEVERISAEHLNLNQWDGVRFRALQESTSSLWNQFNGLYGQLPNLAVDEQVRIKQRMETIRRDLCRDFHEMVQISERVLGVPLEDHYTLHSTCNEGF